MGTIHGFCAISHASAICASVDCFRLAQLLTRSTNARLWAKLSGENRDSTARMSPGANRVFASIPGFFLARSSKTHAAVKRLLGPPSNLEPFLKCLHPFCH